MTALPAHIQQRDFEDWLEQNKHVTRVTDGNMSRFIDLLASEEDDDSYATSPAYYAFTGRRGLWLYHYNDTYLPLCLHPNIDGKIVVFPPRGGKNYAAITAFLNEAPLPPRGFLLARFKLADIIRLKTSHAFARRVSYEAIEEKVLDWRYPVRVLSTDSMVRMQGHDFMLIRNRIRQTKKYPLDIRPLSLKYIPDIEDFFYRWATRQAGNPTGLIDLMNPYKETLRLLRHKMLGLDGLVFIVGGEIQGVTMWDISNMKHKTANLYMHLCNTAYRGLSEFLIKTVSEKLLADDVRLLNLGGSETAGLDCYKNKFVPALSVELCSLKPSIDNASFIVEPAATKEMRIANGIA